MAYPDVLMIDDGLMFKVMHKAGLLNALCCVHAENGAVIYVVVARMLAEGKTEPTITRTAGRPMQKQRPRTAPSPSRT